MSTAVQKSPKPDVAEIDQIAESALASLSSATGSFSKAIAISNAINDLREALGPIMPQFMKLQGTPLGFKTDKDDSNGYPMEIVRDCVIEATLRGVQPAGNQFNIIAKRCYLTKEGYEYKLKHLQGLADLKINIGVPKNREGGAIVDCDATWTYKGQPDSKKAEIPVRVNAGQGADAIIGKAQRKFCKRIFEQITGSPEPSDEDLEDQARALPEPRTPLLDAQNRRREQAAAIAATGEPPIAAAPAKDSPQKRLESWTTEQGFTITQLVVALLDTNFLTDPVQTFEEIPADVATRALRAHKGLLAELQAKATK